MIQGVVHKTPEGAAFNDRRALAAQRFLSPAGASTAASLLKEPSPGGLLRRGNGRFSGCGVYATVSIRSSREPAEGDENDVYSQSSCSNILRDSVDCVAFSVLFSLLSFPFSIFQNMLFPGDRLSKCK